MSGYTNCTVRSAQRTYQLVEEISGGGFGVGYRAIDVRTAGSPEGPTVYFFKVLREATSAVALRELNVARRHAALPRHCFVVRVVDTLHSAAVTVPRGSPALPPVTAIVQEMCNGGDLFTRLALVPNKERGSGVKQVAFDERFARYFCRQLIVGVNHLHSHNIYHRDLKPDNVLLSSCMTAALITDFGTNKRVDVNFSAARPLATATRRAVGTLGYRPPEADVVDGDGYSPAAWDVWALGQTLLVMLAVDCLPIVAASEPGKSRLRLPVETERDVALLDTAAVDGATPTHQRLWNRTGPAWAKLAQRVAALSPEARDLFNRMMEPNPMKRITLGQLLDHPFFQKRLAGDEAAVGVKRRRSSGGAAIDEPTPQEVHAEMCARCSDAHVAQDPEFALGPTSSQGASGWMDRGYLVATASMGAAPGGAPAQAPLPDDLRFMGETFVVDCKRPVGKEGDYYAAEAFCAASARLAALELGAQPQDARDTAALRLRVEGLARGGAFTVQVVAVQGQLYLHLQLVPTAAGMRSPPGGAAHGEPPSIGSASKDGSHSGTPHGKGARAHRAAAALELADVAQRLTELFVHLADDEAHQHAPMERGDDQDDFLMETDANELVPG